MTDLSHADLRRALAGPVARFDVFDATDRIFVISNVERKEADRLARSARKNYPECRIEVRPARPASERLS